MTNIIFRLKPYDFYMDLRLAVKEHKYERTRELTIREKEYLSLVALGFKNPAIAEILFVSFSTVKKTLETVFRKIQAKDRANAVAIGFIHEIITKEFITNVYHKYEKGINKALENNYP